MKHPPAVGTIAFAALMVLGGSALLSAAGAQAAPLANPAELADLRIDALHASAIGVTRKGTPIRSFLCDDDLDYGTGKMRVLLVGGMDGGMDSVQAVVAALRWFHESDNASSWRKRFAVSAVPCVNPDGVAVGKLENLSGGDPSRGYPPSGTAYHSPTDPEAAYLWRWIGMHAPDLVVEVRRGDDVQWHVPKSDDEALGASLRRLHAALSPSAELDASDELVPQLVRQAPCETGRIPAIRVDLRQNDAPSFLKTLLIACRQAELAAPSPAHREVQRRLRRTPLELANDLSLHYGHRLESVQYIPAVALIGRIRVGELTADRAHLADVERIVEPYVNGKKKTSPKSGSHLSGHLVLAELARQAEGEKRDRYIELARVAADLAFDENGDPRPSMPYHSEMSDAVFMGGPILSRTGKLTGDARYFDACVRHVRFMQKLVLREDGLYRHSPLCEAAWGRGNGFPALGLAMVLTDFPLDHPARGELAESLVGHLRALQKHQDLTGCWRQVVDEPGSYRELSCTSMITYAMIRAVRLNLVEPEEFEASIERAWRAVQSRIGDGGRLVDVCTGTGKQKTLRDYYDRTAILGKDDRGGAMALLVATEMAAWQASR